MGRGTGCRSAWGLNRVKRCCLAYRAGLKFWDYWAEISGPQLSSLQVGCLWFTSMGRRYCKRLSWVKVGLGHYVLGCMCGLTRPLWSWDEPMQFGWRLSNSGQTWIRRVSSSLPDSCAILGELSLSFTRHFPTSFLPFFSPYLSVDIFRSFVVAGHPWRQIRGFSETRFMGSFFDSYGDDDTTFAGVLVVVVWDSKIPPVAKIFVS